MFFKQSGFKPRTNSGSAGSDQATTTTQQVTTQQENTAAPTNLSAAAAGRRRSSATEKFAGLQSYKRTSMDQAAQDRKQDFHDQSTAQPGALGQMWNSFTKGTK